MSHKGFCISVGTQESLTQQQTILLAKIICLGHSVQLHPHIYVQSRPLSSIPMDIAYNISSTVEEERPKPEHDARK